MRRRLVEAATLALAAAAQTGCAHTYVDADGSRHVIGLVWARLPAPAGVAAAESLRVRSLGITASSTPAGTAVVLGYSDSNVVVVRDNQCVDAAPLLNPR